MIKIVSNLTNLTTAQNFYDIIKFNDEVTGGIIGALFAFTFMFILLIMFLRSKPDSDFLEALLASSFLTFVISIFLRAMDLISFFLVLIFGLTMAVTGFFVYISKK